LILLAYFGSGFETGIRIAGEPFSEYQNIKVVPLYAVENIRELL